MITLPDPDTAVPAVADLTANNILITGDYGIGKSGLLASTGYLIIDPESKMKSYPLKPAAVTVTTWQDHKDVIKELAKNPGTYKGIGLDSLNVSYDQCTAWVMKNVKFNGVFLSHPSESPQAAYPRVTNEFITWLREVTYLNYHVVATCHTTIAEITSKNGSKYNRWIPAFTGSSTSSTYASVLKVFSIVGFMTMEEIVKPSTTITPMSKGKAVVDVRVDATRLDVKDTRVIHFSQSPNWLANNKLNSFPDKVVLTDNWAEDWDLLKAAWGKGDGHEEGEEEIKTEGLKK